MKIFFKIPILFLVFVGINLNVYAQINSDSLPKKELLDSAVKKQDSIQIDTIKVSKKKEALADIVKHSADERVTIDFQNNITTLYNNAKLSYQDVELEAGIIIIDYKNELIRARGIKDSVGYKQKPYFKQGAEESVQDSLLVNYKTEKALIWGLRTQQEGGMIVGSAVSKKVNDSTLYVRDITITTSDKEPRPDYYININKAKIIPNKKIIAGWSQLFIADVPTPAVMPFTYFPLTKNRTSGVLVPTWGENNTRGYFLQNGGYYLAISDYFDLTLTSDIYTNGSWGLNAKSSYVWRYHYSGELEFKYDNNVESIRGFSDYRRSATYNIQWRHSQDAKANPNYSLSASVNLGSSRYFKESLNEYSNNSYLKNNLNSSVSFSKKFDGTPFNLSLSATHTQNTNTQIIFMTLPTMVLNMDRVYPFAPKDGSKKNALHRLTLGYNFNGKFDIITNDSEFFSKKMFQTARKGLKHAASIGTNMTIFDYFTLSPTMSYNEYWYFDYITKSYNTTNSLVQKDTLNGFKAIRDYSAGVSFSTNIYGTFKFNKGRLKAIRHTIMPSLSYSFRPDFSFYDEKYYDPIKNQYVSYSPYESAMYGYPGKGISNNLAFSIQNTFEAKVMEKDPTKTEPKRIQLLNNLNLATDYDITKDSIRWSDVALTTGLGLFEKKLQVNFNAKFNPYALNASGMRIDKFNIENGGSLFRMTNAGITISYNLSDAIYKKNENEEKTTNTKDNNSDIMGGDLSDVKSIKNEKTTKVAKLYHADVPWKLNLSYSLQFFDNGINPDKIALSSLMFNGDIELTPKWAMGFNSGYDFKNKGITYTQLRFNRDLDSWQMSFNWVPFGYRQTYYFYIGVKSSMLSDLKYDKQSLPDRALF